MTFEAGAWIAGCLGALTGAAASWLNSTRLTGIDGWIDRAMWAIAGAFLAVLAYSVLSLLEGWAAFFQRAASPVIPLLLTILMLAAWVLPGDLTDRETCHRSSLQQSLPPIPQYRVKAFSCTDVRQMAVDGWKAAIAGPGRSGVRMNR
jgi:hypothetical protein